MLRSNALLILLPILGLLPSACFGQKHEIGLTLGGLTSVDRLSTNSIPFTLGFGTALQADYEHRLLSAKAVSLYLGVHLLASPQRQITSPNHALTRDITSLYITPNLMVKLLPWKSIVPWASIGGGYGDYEQSTTVLNGAQNGAPRELSRGVLMYGGGVDFPIWRFVALRAEVRAFYTGNPAYNVPLSSAQNNVSAGGGIVLRFGPR